MNDTVQASGPLMQIMLSLNAGDPTANDASYTTDQAARATAHINRTGGYNGFGSQGLRDDDRAGFAVAGCPGGTSPPNTANNWGCMFYKYWSGATNSQYPPGASATDGPLELQQIDCSKPCSNLGDCANRGNDGDTCFLGSAPGKTKNLKDLYPFATSHYALILELYSQDALLAYDPNFCDLAVTPCDTTNGPSFNGLSSDSQKMFFQKVGMGAGNGNCALTRYSITPQGSSTGDCSYADAIVTLTGHANPKNMFETEESGEIVTVERIQD